MADINNPVFQFAYSITLKNEDSVPSGLVERDSDGGLVKYGINQKDYPSVDVPKLTLEQAKEIYLQIWNQNNLDLLNNHFIAAKIFDLVFNCGDYGGVLILQRAVNSLATKPIAEDGKLGPITANAANDLDPQQLMNAIVNIGQEHYESIVKHNPNDKNWLSSWLARLRQHTQIVQ